MFEFNGFSLHLLIENSAMTVKNGMIIAVVLCHCPENLLRLVKSRTELIRSVLSKGKSKLFLVI